MEKKRIFFNLIFLAVCCYQKVMSKCKNEFKIDLNYPLKRGKYSPEFKFFDVKNPKIQKIRENHFRLIEDFGIIADNGITYKVTQADIFSPSLHSISGQELALEIQLKGYDSSQKTSFTQVFLFEKATVPFVHLFKLGIGRGVIRKLSRKEEDFRESFIKLHTTINFSPYVEDVKRFLRYEGNDFNAKSKRGKCPKTTFNVMFETLWVSREQLEEFGEGSWGWVNEAKRGDLLANFDVYRKSREGNTRFLNI